MKLKRAAAVIVIFSMLLAFTSCWSDPNETSKALPSYVWNGTTITVRRFDERDVQFAMEITVLLKMESEGISLDYFSESIANEMILLDGVMPEQEAKYKSYANGDLISVELYFYMPSDYVLNESDLKIKEQ